MSATASVLPLNSRSFVALGFFLLVKAETAVETTQKPSPALRIDTSIIYVSYPVHGVVPYILFTASCQPLFQETVNLCQGACVRVRVLRRNTGTQQSSRLTHSAAIICPNNLLSDGGDMNGPRRRSRSAVLSRPPEVVAKEYDSSRPDARRPVVTYQVLGADDGLVPQNSWNRVERFQPSLSAFFR